MSEVLVLRVLRAPGGALAADPELRDRPDDAKHKVQGKRLRLFGVYPVDLRPFRDDTPCPARCQTRAAVALPGTLCLYYTLEKVARTNGRGISGRQADQTLR